MTTISSLSPTDDRCVAIPEIGLELGYARHQALRAAASN
jgi:hypothetical protein